MNKRILASVSTAALAATVIAQPRLSAGSIDEIISQMTLKEKVVMLVGSIDGTNYTGIPTPTGDPDTGQLVPGAAGQTNRIPRLGIPATVVGDGPAGLRVLPTRSGSDQTYYCTGFPVGILLSSTWNEGLMNQVGKAIGNELKEYGVDALLAPAVNIMRNPLCGRNFEYLSEDPVLSGKMAASEIRGIQSQGVGTSLKHFAANNQETNRTNNDARMSQRTLRELYLKPFEIAVKESQPWSVMSSYNKINGQYSAESYDLLTTILREEWGFKGFVMTDWSGLKDTAAEIHAGNDLLMPGFQNQVESMMSEVEKGNLKESDVDICLKRILEYVVKTPRFLKYSFSNAPDLTAHAQVSRQAATEGIVLLKNNGCLPLKQDGRQIALFGVASYRFIADGTGSGHVNTPYVVNLIQGLTSAGYQTNEQLKTLYEKHIETEDAKFALLPISKQPVLPLLGISAHIPELPLGKFHIATTTEQSDMAIITIGRKPGEGFDRNVENDFDLSETEKDLIKTVCEEYHQKGKQVIVILNTGGIVETASWKELPDAILMAWMPGQEGGNAVADVLTGKVNPSGRLPITFPVSYWDVPGAKDFPYDFQRVDDGMFGLSTILGPKRDKPTAKNLAYTEYNEGINVGYRYYTTADWAVSYPFGYGLSYTRFEYGKPVVKAKGNQYVVKVTVRNIGETAGKEVLQLYVSAPKGNMEKPVRELKAFGKTRELQPGESQTLTLTFNKYDLASFDESASAWKTDAGTYTIAVGAHVNDIKATATVKVSKSVSYPVHNVLAPQK